MQQDEIEPAVLHAIEIALEAQLKAIRRFRAAPPDAKAARKGTSQIDMVQDVLRRADKPLHASDIISQVETLYGIKLDRQSVVSTLVKKVKRGDLFTRTDKNVFGLKSGE